MKKGSITQAQPMNNPNHTLENVERNRELFKDFQNGMELFELCAKYKITTTRIGQIVNREKKRQAFLDNGGTPEDLLKKPQKEEIK